MVDHIPKEKLIQYLEKALSPSENVEILDHLRTCIECNKTVESLEFLNEMVELSGTYKDTGSEFDIALISIDDEIDQLVYNSKPIRKSQYVFRKTLLAIAAVMLLAFSITFFANSYSPMVISEDLELYDSEGRSRTPSEDYDNFKFKIILDSNAYLYILSIEKPNEISFLFPFSEDNWTKFGLTGYFSEGEEILIPPHNWDVGFGIQNVSNIGVFILISTRIKISETELNKILIKLRDKPYSDILNHQELINKVFQFIKKRFISVKLYTPNIANWH